MRTRPAGLAGYASLSGAFLALAAPAAGKVVYTDLDPDALALVGSVFIDMDDDGVPDFEILQSSTPLAYFALLYGSRGVGSGYGFVGLPAYPLNPIALSAGAMIGPSAAPMPINTFGTMGLQLRTTNLNTVGDWGGATDKYLGVSFNLPDGVHYGWIRCDVPTTYTSVTVKDFAYEGQPGVAIEAGDRGCSTDDGPENLAHTITIDSTIASTILLQWDPVINSVACQVEGSSPLNPVRRKGLFGTEVSSMFFPSTLLGPDSSLFQWRVRCACSLFPPDVTPWSAYDGFFIPFPPLRQTTTLQELAARLTPNPADDQTRLFWTERVARETDLRITDAQGRLVDFIRVPAGRNELAIDVSTLEPGNYLLQLDGREALPLVVSR